MDSFTKKLGIDISKYLSQAKVTELNYAILPAPNEYALPFILPNAFYADGSLNGDEPKLGDDLYITPKDVPLWLNTPIPAAFLDIEPSFSRSACISALEYGERFIDEEFGGIYELVGFRFYYETNRESFPIAFPALLAGKIIRPIIAIADTWRNDAYWEDGAVPLYVMQQANFLMWTISYFVNHVVPAMKFSIWTHDVLVVRIVGNLPTDCSVRIVKGNASKEEAVAKRLFRAVSKGWKDGIAIPEPNRFEEPSFKERMEAIPVLEDNDLHELIGRYMEKRSARKELDAQNKAMKSRQDAIAHILAEKIPTGYGGAKFTLSNGATASVYHKCSSANSEVSITPPLIQQFAPEAAHCIAVANQTEWKVTVDAL